VIGDRKNSAAGRVPTNRPRVVTVTSSMTQRAGKMRIARPQIYSKILARPNRLPVTRKPLVKKKTSTATAPASKALSAPLEKGGVAPESARLCANSTEKAATTRTRSKLLSLPRVSPRQIMCYGLVRLDRGGLTDLRADRQAWPFTTLRHSCHSCNPGAAASAGIRSARGRRRPYSPLNASRQIASASFSLAAVTKRGSVVGRPSLPRQATQ
jgi:hypothetical protein